MTSLAKLLATLAALLIASLIFSAGYLTNGYLQRGELLASYNGANQMRQDARVDTAKAEAAVEKVAQFFRGLSEEQAGPLPAETPGTLQGRQL